MSHSHRLGALGSVPSNTSSSYLRQRRSCHDLSEVILTKFGVNIRTQYLIPPEHAFAGMFGDGKEKFDEAFYPNIFDRVMRDIAPERGELILIAAGFLGKLLCERVRERGGIGFDVGSIVDVWIGAYNPQIRSH